MVVTLMPGIAGLSKMVARLVRPDLLAVFEPTIDNFLELGSSFVRTNLAKELPKAQLALDQATARQLLRSPDATFRRTEAYFAEHNSYQFAVDSIMAGVTSLQPRDMVYVEDDCTIGEVESVADDGSLSLMLAGELQDLPNRSCMQSFFRFTEDSEHRTNVNVKTVCFPIDLAFNAAAGYFTLRKSKNLHSV